MAHVASFGGYFFVPVLRNLLDDLSLLLARDSGGRCEKFTAEVFYLQEW